MALLRHCTLLMLAAALFWPLAAMPADYVGEASCAACHPSQQRAWAGSQHARAMQPAEPGSVLGDFSGVRVNFDGIKSKLFRRDGKFQIETEGPEGKLANFEINYAFGIEPLQQYLVEMPGGRLQALRLAWDVKQKRWIQLYPQEKHLDFHDPLHWTRAGQTANSNCATCHTTAFRKNYRQDGRRYETTWASLGVGCQACHGPASTHLAWAAEQKAGSKGFAVTLNGPAQLDSCAPCHGMRTQLLAAPEPGAPLLDQYLPMLLDEGRYWPDGQQQDEVFVYASWLQSKMHSAGMRCSDCHEVHGGKLKLPGNAVCVSCHNATAPAYGAHIDARGLQRKNYDSAQHHFHTLGKAGSACVDCHAPAATYMVVDPRRDHSFRIPRPDLTLALGTPNACNGCHDKRAARWAQEQIERWYGPQNKAKHFGLAIEAGRRGAPGAAAGLLRLAGDSAQPTIVRATALSLLRRYPGRQALDQFRRALLDPDPLVRRVAVLGHEWLPPRERVLWLAPLLDDTRRAVRIEAARLLTGAALPDQRQPAYERALSEYLVAQHENAERPNAQLALGDLHAARGNSASAEAAYGEAIALEPGFVPAYINLADLYRRLGREQEALALLRQGLRAAPRQAALHEALALALVRDGNKNQALRLLRSGTKIAGASARTHYLYSVTLYDSGRKKEAMAALSKALMVFPGDRELLLALADYRRAAGDQTSGEAMLDRLAAINPDDPALSKRNQEKKP